ncbi:MAG: GLUG motif-containing protein, partial [Anaerovoracaceae bacterium]
MGGVAISAKIGTDYSITENKIAIKTEKGLAWFANAVNTSNDVAISPSANVTLENNLDLVTPELVTGYNTNVTPGNSWIPIGTETVPFTGTFDGNGHTITGVKINSTSKYIGLFKYTSNANIKNLVVADSSFETTATSEETIKGCGRPCIGGIVGYQIGGSISGCTVRGGSVQGSSNCLASYIGGIVGYSKNAKIENCKNMGCAISTTANDCKIGGIIGIGYIGTLSGATNTGTVTISGAVNYGGGLMGGGNNFNIEDSHNDGIVSGSQARVDAANLIGGLIGEYQSGIIKNSYNTGAVTGRNTVVYGLVAYAYTGVKIQNCYNTGNLTSDDGDYQVTVGGIARTNGSVMIDNCYNAGDIKVSSTETKCGIAPYNGAATVKNCFYKKAPGLLGRTYGADIPTDTLGMNVPE